MVYAISDLHGYPPERLQALLRLARFGQDDFLYVLGDVIDRSGDGGVGVLRWLSVQPNAQLLLGNHEAMLLACSFLFEEVTADSLAALTAEHMAVLDTWRENGGDVTIRALQRLDRETIADLLDYLRDAPLYDLVTAGGRDFLLVHAGLEHFRPDRRLSDYSSDELLWAWPTLTDRYFDDIRTVFGHTPTGSFDPAFEGRVLHTDTWTCIDCGAGHGNEPVLLRLDDMAEFRLEKGEADGK